MRWFLNAFGGTMGVVIAIGCVLCLCVGGCVLLCTGAPLLLVPAVKQANEAAERARDTREAQTPLAVQSSAELQSAAGAVNAVSPTVEVVQPAKVEPVETAAENDDSAEEVSEPADEAATPGSTEVKTAPLATEQAREVRAKSKFEMAKALFLKDRDGVGKKRLKEVVDQFPGTKAAEEAAKLLKR